MMDVEKNEKIVEKFKVSREKKMRQQQSPVEKLVEKGGEKCEGGAME